MALNKYALYERSVQSPDVQIRLFLNMYRELHSGRYPRRLREDFCGTFQIACEWVARNRRNEAIALDLDPEPLAYGKRHHLRAMTADQRKRLQPLLMDVNSVTEPRSDLIVAGNFSFCVFKERKQLIRYFRFARRSLAKDGIFVLEQAGGPGMIEPTRDRVPVFGGKGKNRKRAWTYVWDQKSFDPITHDARYGIHFEFPSGKKLRDAFTYDWRLWTLPELRDAMTEAGFSRTVVYWETEHKGRGTGEYAQMKQGDNAYSWVAFVIGVR